MLDTLLSDELLKKVAEQLSILTLVNTEKDGRIIWAYIAIPPDTYKKLLEGEIAEPFALDDIGTVIVSGEGVQPPESVKHDMAAYFGANHDLLKEGVSLSLEATENTPETNE